MKSKPSRAAPKPRRKTSARTSAAVERIFQENEEIDRQFEKFRKPAPWQLKMIADAEAAEEAEAASKPSQRQITASDLIAEPVMPTVEPAKAPPPPQPKPRQVTASSIIAAPKATTQSPISSTITVTRTEAKVVAGAVGTILLLALLRRCPCP